MSRDMEKIFDRVIKALRNQKLMNQLGLAAERIIKKRVREGKDVDGSRFRPYSEKYLQKREIAGLQTDPVNLMWNNYDGMMHHVDHIVSRDVEKVLVYIKGGRNRRIARYHNVSGAGRSRVIREFMGLSEAEQKKITALAGREIGKILKGLN